MQHDSKPHAELVPAAISSSDPDVDARGLFIVGHARTGTSILLDGLNSSADVYMLGEANLHLSAARPHFVAWYNDMHRQLGNPEYKATYLPENEVENANGFDVIGALSRRFKYVGDKLAFRSERLGYDFEGYLRFAARHFLRSVYICPLRNPVHVIASCLDKFESGSRSPETIEMYAESFLRTLYLQLRCLFLFNRTYFVIHDRMSARTFEVLSKELGIDLSDAWRLYDETRMHTPPARLPELESSAAVRRTCAAYEDLVHHLSDETLRPVSLWSCRSLMYQLRKVTKEEVKDTVSGFKRACS